MRRLLLKVDPDMADRMIESMGKGTPRRKFNNADCAFRLPSDPFETVGRLGYKAQDRELFALIKQLNDDRPEAEGGSRD